MYYTPKAAESEGFVFDVDSLYAYFTRITDHLDRRGLRYSLELILTLVVLAKLGGEDHPTGFEQWAQARAGYLLPALGAIGNDHPHTTPIAERWERMWILRSCIG